MDKQTNEWVAAMMKPGMEAFEYWVSFFPVAPMFGVEWRFGQADMGFSAFTGSVTGAAAPEKKSPKAVAKVIDAVSKPATTAKAPQAAPKPAPKPKAAKAPAKTVSAEDAAARSNVVTMPKPKAAASKPAPAPKASLKTAQTKTASAAKTEEKAKAPDATATPSDGKPAGLLAAAPAKSDDLKLIKGVGPGLEKQLNALGVYQFSQLAAFSQDDLQWVDDNLTSFKGRCFRDDWIGQASALMAS